MRDDEYEPNRFLGFPVRTGPQARKDEKPQAGEDDEYEPNRFLGFPVRTGPQARKDQKPQAGEDTEPRRVMGFPVDLFSDREWLGALAHPVRDYQRWRRRRARSGTGEDEPRGGR
jgi:hypothetical protein